MTCPYCESDHKGICPRVKSIEYADEEDGARILEWSHETRAQWCGRPNPHRLGDAIQRKRVGL